MHEQLRSWHGDKEILQELMVLLMGDGNDASGLNVVVALLVWVMQGPPW